MNTAELHTTEQPRPDLDNGRLRIQTRFGEFESDPRNVLHFPVGLPGFEQCRRFVVLSSMAMAPVQCLHAVDGPPASFLVVDPRVVLPGQGPCFRLASRSFGRSLKSVAR